VIATTTDNRKWHGGRQNRKYLYIWNRDIYDRNSEGKSGFFDHAELEEAVPADCNYNIDVLGGNFATFGFSSPSLSQSLGYTFVGFLMVENAGFAVGISMLSLIVSEI